MQRLELIGITHHVDRARSLAEAVKGRLLLDDRDGEELPYRALISAVTDDPEPLMDAAEVGVYVVCRRVMRPRPDDHAPDEKGRLPGVFGLYTMAHHPDLTHRQADEHWRDRHTPLAFEHHPLMTHYTQLSVVHRVRGPEWDGFALCGLPSVEDLRQRFFGSPEGKAAIRDDIATFADTRRPQRRLIATEWSWEP